MLTVIIYYIFVEFNVVIWIAGTSNNHEIEIIEGGKQWMDFFNSKLLFSWS